MLDMFPETKNYKNWQLLHICMSFKLSLQHTEKCFIMGIKNEQKYNCIDDGHAFRYCLCWLYAVNAKFLTGKCNCIYLRRDVKR